MNIESLNYHCIRSGISYWTIDVTPIFQDRFGKEIIKSATFKLPSCYNDYREWEIRCYCDSFLDKYKKNPRYMSIMKYTEIEIEFTNGKKLYTEADDNELSLMS